MTTHQNDGDPPFTRDAGRIPLEVLRDFALEQTQLHGYRATAHRWKMGHETLRKFATGRTVHPHPRQRESMGLEFLELYPGGYVRDGTADGRPRALRRLKSLLPPERER
ncbi:MAG TPA: hypothetical protein VHG93_27360, partial [Longimicrobium sp.]|nr:hypothetical protein [Longimicrobium sp.]